MAILTSNNVLVAVSSLAGDWVRGSGHGGSTTVNRMRSVAAGPKQVVLSEYEPNDVTTARLVDPVRDESIITQLAEGARFEGTTLTIQPLDDAGIAVGKPQTIKNCAVSSWSLGDADANGDGVVELEIVWAVEAPSA